MTNTQKNNAYRKIKEGIENLNNPSSRKDIESIISRAFFLFSDKYIPSEYPESDFGKRIITSLSEYSNLLSHRRKINIAGAEREVALEPESLRALFLAENLSRELLIPFFNCKSDVSNKVFNDIHHLSFAYLHAIVNCVADEYLDREEAFESKKQAIGLAKEGIRVYDSYQKYGFSQKTLNSLDNFKKVLNNTSTNFLRSPELVLTSEKNIYKGRQLMEDLKSLLTKEDSNGNLSFKPNIILPIAHGGTELGVRLSNAFEDLGHYALTYPLLYSMKTRKHKYPWIHYDIPFLNDITEKKILITDDWVTTGNTLQGILDKLKNFCPGEMRIATIKRDREKSFIPSLENYHFYVGALCIYSGNKSNADSPNKI